MPLAAVKSSARNSSSRSTGSWEQLAVIGLGALAVLGIARKLRRMCLVPVAADDVAIVFNIHRRSVFSTSEDRNLFPPTPSGLGDSGRKYSKLVQMAGSVVQVVRLAMHHGLWPLVFPACRAYVVRPPLPLFHVFTLPRAVLDGATGVAVDCSVADVPVTDGVLRMTLTIVFYVDLQEVNRYLTLLGPVPPHEALGKAVSQCLRQLARRCSSGILLAKQRRTTVFLPDLTTQLRTVLCADCSVRLKTVTIEAVQLMDAPMSPSR